MARQAVFYYPVQWQRDDVLIYYAYETETVQGVTILLDDTTYEAISFATMQKAALYCHRLNARQRVFPRSLPLTALRFLLERTGRLRYHEQNGRQFLVMPVEA